MKVVLLGYMGSGKSVIGSQLAQIMSTTFIDLDDYISDKADMSISEMFKTKGEIYFRKLEHTCLKEILAMDDDMVLALGGGTPCYANNMVIIKENSTAKSMYLRGSVKTLSERLFLEKDKRPLLSNIKDLEELQEFIGKHLFERNHYYNQAGAKIMIDNKTIQDILEDIVLSLV